MTQLGQSLNLRRTITFGGVLRWFTDSAEAARHPVKASAFSGLVVAAIGVFLAYIEFGFHSPAEVAAFSILLGAVVGASMYRWLREYQRDPTPRARRERARRAGLRLGISWVILLLSVVIAVAAGSFGILVVGVALAVAIPLLLRLRHH